MLSTRRVPIPRTAAALGYGGLIPFMCLAVAALVREPWASNCTHALYLYGGMILSFVGALHWAFAMTIDDLGDGERVTAFAWSIFPALLAWVALLLMPPATGVLLMAGFVAHYWRDRVAFRRDSIPDWYLPLRFRLTLVAVLCLGAATAPFFK